MKFVGTWHIFEMEIWDEDYFNMEVQAYIKIASDGSGEFQFGLVQGYIDGDIAADGKTERFDFTWEGSDENDSASGSGWIKIKEKDVLEGRITFHTEDSSGFSARRSK